ncbi:hypothetical protein CEXT_696791 [Caerostris extrusa]|uniref:Uncharacterized protein n=1 Tax=Caerostris extrusa TaxID=172846 RepID=A0AAV4T0C2_CAEEX|nr:hypothetical protein CEXT_696791 [Caerostris extrusa]
MSDQTDLFVFHGGALTVNMLSFVSKFCFGTCALKRAITVWDVPEEKLVSSESKKITEKIKTRSALKYRIGRRCLSKPKILTIPRRSSKLESVVSYLRPLTSVEFRFLKRHWCISR